MAVYFESTPTANTIEFKIAFLSGDAIQSTLGHGQTDVLTFGFDALGVGNSEPLSIYRQETPGDITIPPGNLAFVDRSVNRKIALRYGTKGGTQHNIVFVLD